VRSLFSAQLVNDPFGDPGLYVDFLTERRAFLVDLGDIHALAPRHLLRVTHLFVTHTHMDHFYGFDYFVRVLLGRDKTVHLYGPPGFIENVEGRLSSYTWNLIHLNREVLDLRVHEWDGGPLLRGASFSSRNAFKKRPLASRLLEGNLLCEAGGVQVRAAVLDHKIPVLGFRIDEPPRLNICRERLGRLGLKPGPWLRELKEALSEGLPPSTPIELPSGEKRPLEELRAQIVKTTPGWSVGYLTDLIYSRENIAAAKRLLSGVHTLFIEARFAHRDLELAEEHHHLTAWQAGDIARRLGAERVVPFHFSPRYRGREEEQLREVERGFRGEPLEPNGRGGVV